MALRSTQLVGFGGGAPFNPVDLPGLYLFLDADEPDCYPGSGTALTNLANAGAEPDFKTNNTPTFVARAGSLGAHFLHGGTSYINNDGTLGTFLRDLHNNSSVWTIIDVSRPPITSSGVNYGASQCAWNTMTGTTASSHGVCLMANSGDSWRLIVRGNAVTALSTDFDGGLVGYPADDPSGCINVMPQMTAVAIDEAATTGKVWKNGHQLGTFTSTFTSPSFTNSSGFAIGAETDGGNPVRSGQRWHATLVFNRVLSDEELQLLWKHYSKKISYPGEKELWRAKMKSNTVGDDWTVAELEMRVASTPDYGDAPFMDSNGTSRIGNLADIQDGDTGTSEKVNNARTADEGWMGYYYEGGIEIDDARIYQLVGGYCTAIDIESSTDLGETWQVEYNGTGLSVNTWDTIS